MTSLRARLAALLVVAILAVVVIAAAVTVRIVERPRGDAPPDALFAEQTHRLIRLIGGSADRAAAVGIPVGGAPPASASAPPHEPGATLFDPAVRIVRSPDGDAALAVPLEAGRWAYLPTLRGPPSPVRPLAAYLALVVLGAPAVSLYAASRIVGPLAVLEAAAIRIRPDGTLPHVPEEGPAEVKATARALNALSQRLASATESRMRLVAAAGHDLRTPMTRMRLRAEFLPEEDRATWLRDLAELDAIADSAIRLVQEEASAGERRSLDLGALLSALVGELGEIGLVVAIEGEMPPASVRGEPLGLRRAFGNLLENAARHGQDASVRMREAAGHGIIEIDDRGPGIPDALLDRVFEPFVRVDPARGRETRASGAGAGLGLAIAREIVERHGGTIAIANREGGGLRQSVSLPLG
ncbi:ATP-binding protein [Aureimonas pseudogalii]|uniref:histidine kinase n=1 Tax=Aureimonas pseudogalii TaxID=1744844 RepID=A0A7W6EFJ9_9HYPH|nr:ATP-binding protein [Aureimonas pseudogalii]MBB3998517.1 signal transduction histidine kinase [Aureimonas pseudogalii]